MTDTIKEIKDFQKEYNERRNYISDINERLKKLLQEFTELSKRYHQESDFLVLDEVEKFKTLEEAEKYLINMVAVKKANTLQDERFQDNMTKITGKSKEDRNKDKIKEIKKIPKERILGYIIEFIVSLLYNKFIYLRIKKTEL